MNQKLLFNEGWEFAKSSLDVTDPAGLSFQPVDLPHDWLIEDTLNLYEDSIGWYRKRFQCPAAEQILLAFDGVYMDSTLYVNRQKIGEWKYGYSSFEHDISRAVVAGENEILVKVVHQAPNSRWYSGAGIYRNVWLKTRGQNRIVTNGIYVSTRRVDPVTDRWLVEVETTLEIKTQVELTQTILAPGQVVTSSTRVIRPDEASAPVRQELWVEKPLRWSPDQPYLYRLVTQLKVVREGQAGKDRKEEVESITQNVGFREIILHPDRGLLLNGERLKLHGTCEHHDLGALGAAFNKTALKRRFKLLKEMGVNALRTAHNMPAPEFMDLADEMGFLVVSEAFDMWERPKTPYDYARFFKEWVQKDVKSWVTRDRNHPSLLMWSIGNEIYDTHADERGQEVTKMLMAFVRRYDPKENAAITIGSNYMAWPNAQKCADLVKVAGYNYGEKLYQEHHAAHPDWVIYGSETGSVVQSRGVYHFPLEKAILTDDDGQCSALGNSSVSYGAKSAEACIRADRDAPFSLGHFIWSGFDYLGEPNPYHTKNSYFGQLDTATFKKDSYYIYQAAWTDYKTNPMIHLFPYWDFNPGQKIDVRVCSNAPRIELQLNGRTVGTKELDPAMGTPLLGWWQIPYQEGELKAIAYDENGRVIATAVRRSFKDPAKIRLRADKEKIWADGTDLLFVEITMEDEAGNPVENASNRVAVRVTGAGRLLGLDNGDSTDFDQFKGLSRRLFKGKLMAIIGATLEPGKIQVEVTSPGLPSQRAEYEALPALGQTLHGISARARNRERPCVTGREEEIPVRKIELCVDHPDRVLTKERREVTVRARLYPANTSYPEVEWKVVTAGGIETPVAKVAASGHEARVTALGDGAFRLRCLSKNGTGQVRLFSELEFEAAGIGPLFKNPYEFISAGLYDYSQGEVGNGIEKGVATSRDGETQVGFRDLDFGPEGSDEITILVFALTGDEYALAIWEGIPGEAGSSLLAEVTYQKEPIWNVYQAATYRLNKRLRGVTSLCFVTRQKMHIKGFSFTRQQRVLSRIDAAACDRIYGDTFTIREKRVEGIGNNVTLDFGQLDFGEEGVTQITICGRSLLEKNTIHLRFSGPDGDWGQIIEFLRAPYYEEQVFPLERISGKQKLSFIFLPGSQFDFGWFRFT
ncbi:MAG: DUF4982 domain-containing protein [Firmicutes bacterium]|nr:DUF4982 domain-containing protein [Bacillota bacterium]